MTLRIKDVDLDRCEIVVRSGKGGKDRRTHPGGLVPKCAARPPRDAPARVRRGPSGRRPDDRHSGFSASQVSEDRCRLALAIRVRGCANVHGLGRHPPTAPLARDCRSTRLQGGRRRRGHRQARVLPYPSPLVRDTPAGIRGRYPDRSGALRPHESSNDDGLHPCLEPWRPRCPKPGRQSLRLGLASFARGGRVTLGRQSAGRDGLVIVPRQAAPPPRAARRRTEVSCVLGCKVLAV